MVRNLKYNIKNKVCAFEAVLYDLPSESSCIRIIYDDGFSASLFHVPLLATRLMSTSVSLFV